MRFDRFCLRGPFFTYPVLDNAYETLLAGEGSLPPPQPDIKLPRMGRKSVQSPASGLFTQSRGHLASGMTL